MATAACDPSVALQDEATCSICLDFFQDPVMIIDCGHNFCRACITRCQDAPSRGLASCPQCRSAFPLDNLRPNRHLGNMVAVIQGFRLQRLSEAETGEEKKACKKHKEALKLFCLQDRAFICLVCRESRAHKAHAVVPIDEAVQEYKGQIKSCLETLKKEKDEIMKEKSGIEKKIQAVKKRVGCFKQNITTVTFPKEKSQSRLALLEACDENMKTIDEIAIDFSGRSSHLAKLIRELEEKCLQSAFEFLQDIDLLMSRCETEKKRKSPVDLKRKVEALSEKMKLSEAKLSELSAHHQPFWTIESMTFDEETAHPRLIVSRSGKSVRWADDVQFDLMPWPQRFEQSRCVLSCERFNSGWHIWHVEVVDEGPWAIGVAVESVRRKGPIHLDPNEGVWAISFSNGNYWMHSSPKTFLALSFDPKVIVVALQYEAGQISFSDFHSQTHLCTLESGSFMGKSVHAFFRIGSSSSYLRLCSPAYLQTHFPDVTFFY